MKPDSEEYYEYVLVYIDDLLVSMGHDACTILEEVRKEGRFKIKGNRIEEPSTYLGASVERKQMNGYSCWTKLAKQVHQPANGLETKMALTSSQMLLLD